MPKSLSREEARERDPLGEFLVWWKTEEGIQPHRDALREALGDAEREQDLQECLEEHPELLVDHLAGGHGRYVIPQASLGGEHFPDFLVGEAHSYGFDWLAVELKRHDVDAFTEAGEPARHLRRAIRQVMDWREWLRANGDYARRPRSEEGLGLSEIDDDVPALILISRRDSIDPSADKYRRRFLRENNIEIHSWDFLLGFGADEAFERRLRRIDDPER